jgi:hypothetical protein
MGLENARAFAQAEFDLAQVRVAKVAVIQKVALTRAEEPMRFATRDQAWQFVRGFARGKLIGPMPLKEPERTDEALRRVLSVLIKLERYEHCAAVRRARALHKFLEAKKSKTT